MQLRFRRRFAAPESFHPARVPAREHLERGDIDPREKSLSYRDLETISRLPFQFGPLWRAVRRMAERSPAGSAPSGGQQGGESGRPLVIVEVGAGTGAVGLRIARRLARSGRETSLISTDLSPERLPRASASGGVSVRYDRLDVLVDPIPEADIVIANLLIHHLSDEGAGALLRKMDRATRLGAAVFDLDRNPWAFHFLQVFVPLWARSGISAADALISVQQAFRTRELRELALEAGIRRPRLRRYLGLRTLLWWEKGP